MDRYAVPGSWVEDDREPVHARFDGWDGSVSLLSLSGSLVWAGCIDLTNTG